MTDLKDTSDLGLIITKAPAESGAVANALQMARGAQFSGNRIALFLISDGVWLAKAGQKNRAFNEFCELLNKGVRVTLSQEHLEAAGMGRGELVDGVDIVKKVYDEMVDQVMEQWNRVVVV